MVSCLIRPLHLIGSYQKTSLVDVWHLFFDVPSFMQLLPILVAVVGIGSTLETFLFILHFAGK